MKAKNFIMLCGTTSMALFGCQNAVKTDGNAHFTQEEKDTTVALGDDFYQYTNGGWRLQHPLPADKSRLGSFDLLYDDNEEKLKSLVEETLKTNNAEGSAAQKIADLYKCSIDTATRNANGAKMLDQYFAKIDAGFDGDAKSVAETMEMMQEIGAGGFFSFGSDVDADNSNQTICQLWQRGIGLPDRDYYFELDDKKNEIIAAYKKQLNTYATLLGWENAEARVEAIYGLEEKLAGIMYTRTQNRDPKGLNNKRDLEQLKAEIKGIDWEAFFNAAGVKVETINVAQYNYFTKVGEILNSTDKEVLKDYYKMRLTRGYASDMSSDFENASFEYAKVITGAQEMKPLWKRALANVNGVTGELLGQVFVEKYFPAAAKTRMVELIENLRTAFAQRIENLTWMSDSTKIQAKEKLAAITVKVGYPDKWEDYTDLKIDKNLSLVENLINANRFGVRKDYEKINKPVDKAEWFMTPQTVNAYYNPSFNEIVFPAGILQPPFFYAEGDDAVNYGAIGVVIGHEMTHGFDDQGCQFDKDGNLKNWWTEEDAEKFKVETDKLVKRFEGFIAVGDLHANGVNTLGENIADLGGLNIAYQAYQNASNGKTVADIDGQTDKQRFCYSYSRIWAQNIREEALYQQVKTDPHSPGHLRVNGPLPLVDFFYEAFGINENDKMFVPKDERIVIW